MRACVRVLVCIGVVSVKRTTMCMCFVGGGGVRLRARVCTTLHWGCFRYDNYTQGMQLCVCILWECVRVRVCVF